MFSLRMFFLKISFIAFDALRSIFFNRLGRSFLDSNGSDNPGKHTVQDKKIRSSYRNAQRTENKGEIAETDIPTC